MEHSRPTACLRIIVQDKEFLGRRCATQEEQGAAGWQVWWIEEGVEGRENGKGFSPSRAILRVIRQGSGGSLQLVLLVLHGDLRIPISLTSIKTKYTLLVSNGTGYIDVSNSSLGRTLPEIEEEEEEEEEDEEEEVEEEEEEDGSRGWRRRRVAKRGSGEEMDQGG
uniref:Uncharacterized protein n=1 Tax=Vespula pensylvanica TaxID=30213 RepID=A0A834UDR5_VESPE|nr:hypothetical protein H0235_002164 [Vespula pensylvanica]